MTSPPPSSVAQAAILVGQPKKKNKPRPIVEQVPDYIRGYQKEMTELKKITAAALPQTTPTTLISKATAPEQSCNTEVKVILLSMLDEFDLNGLDSALRSTSEWCRDQRQVSKDKSFRDFEKAKPSDSQNLLCCCEVAVLKAFIRGDAPHMEASSSVFHQKLNNHHLRKVPGNYIQFICRRNADTVEDKNGTQSSTKWQNDEYAGCGLSWNELEDVYQAGMAYIDPNQAQVGWDIDDTFEKHTFTRTEYDAIIIPNGPSQLGKRERFLNSKKNMVSARVKVIEEWLKAIRVFLDEFPPNIDKDEPMRVCFVEVGWGRDLAARALAHEDFDSSNYLLSLFRCLVKYAVDPSGTTFIVRRYMINALPRPSEALIDAHISDVMTTILASSFWFQGGLNPSEAGGGGVQAKALQAVNHQILDQYNAMYQQGSLHRINLKRMQEKVAETKKAHDTFRDRAAVEQRIDLKKQKLSAKIKKAEETMKKLTIAHRIADLKENLEMGQRRNVRGATPGMTIASQGRSSREGTVDTQALLRGSSMPPPSSPPRIKASRLRNIMTIDEDDEDEVNTWDDE
ncbi:hypothetical protein LTR66_012556 [Elasticomyces elasticus]|nr:hypothetical protein LTR66_012556 [Elasticomyces elasticus]